MLRFIEFILGLDRDVLSQRGEYSLTFDPIWPMQEYIPAWVWNVLLAALIVVWVWRIYRRETGSARLRHWAAAFRLVLLVLVLIVLNRPMLSLTQTRTEPSVLGVAIDDSMSMQVADEKDAGGKMQSRLAAVQQALTGDGGALLGELSAKHDLRFYHFSSGPAPMATVSEGGASAKPGERASSVEPSDMAGTLQQIEQLKPIGQSTRLHSSIQQIAQQLQGQRLAGLVVFTDGHEMPPLGTDATSQLPAVRLFPVPVGSEAKIRNVAIRSVTVQDLAYKGDLVSIRVQVAVTGADKDQPLRLDLRRADGSAVPGIGGRDATTEIRMNGDGTYDTDIVFPARDVGTMDLVVSAQKLPGEIAEDDNSRPLQLTVIDAKVNLLYVDGYPRWEYRYLKTQMMRDKTVNISTLLTSADPDYVQEGTKPIRFFPNTMDQLLEYDVVLLGDVDPRQFTDAQLGLVRDFVMKKGGGFGMISGPRFTPYAWRGTPIENVLPVDIAATRPDDQSVDPFRPVLTPEGQQSPIFRFFADRAANENYIRNVLPQLYWFARGVSARPAIAETYAEHPTSVGPDGHKAPLLVVGRPGAGRSLFSAIDDSWRWRYYTGESIFDTYWLQQVRYLARGRKIGQRRIAFVSVAPVYEVGEQVQLELRVIDDVLASQLPDSLGVEVYDASGKLVAHENLTRHGAKKDTYRLLLPAGEAGRFTAKLPSVAAGVDAAQATYDVVVPRLELSDPSPERSVLSQYAARTDGRVIDLSKARAQLLAIPSAARMVPVQTSWRLWSSPFLLGLLVLLLTIEWALRKFAGLI